MNDDIIFSRDTVRLYKRECKICGEPVERVSTRRDVTCFGCKRDKAKSFTRQVYVKRKLRDEVKTPSQPSGLINGFVNEYGINIPCGNKKYFVVEVSKLHILEKRLRDSLK